jgi:hypothetical protein
VSVCVWGEGKCKVVMVRVMVVSLKGLDLGMSLSGDLGGARRKAIKKRACE